MNHFLLLLIIVMAVEIASIQVNSIPLPAYPRFSLLRFRGGATEAAPQYGKLPSYVANAHVEPTKAVERSSNEAINVRLVPTEEETPIKVHPIFVWWFMAQFAKAFIIMCIPHSFHSRFAELPTVPTLLLLGTPVAESVICALLVAVLRCINPCLKLFKK